MTVSVESAIKPIKVAAALDLPEPAENIELVKKISELLPEHHRSRLALKIGLNTFIAGGPGLVQFFASSPFEVVLDLKLPDIPNTMASAAKQIAKLKASMFTIHASMGADALRQVRDAIRSPENSLKMLAVTVLTSFSEEQCQRLYKRSIAETVKDFVAEAVHGGADGIVCSPLELPQIDAYATEAMGRQGPAPKLIKFVPGIELAPRKDDQKRKGGLREVVQGGADYIVVGRPIYQSQEPALAVQKIIDKLDRLQRLQADFEAETVWQ